jgi:hypothetical protein
MARSLFILNTYQNVRSLDNFLRRLRRVIDLIVLATHKTFVAETAEAIAEEARNRCPVWTGQLRDSIVVTDIPASGKEVAYGGKIVAVTAPYALPVEFGGRPHWPPIGAISNWADDHNWTPEDLAEHIFKFGTVAKPFFRPAAEMYTSSEHLNNLARTTLYKNYRRVGGPRTF